MSFHPIIPLNYQKTKSNSTKNFSTLENIQGLFSPLNDTWNLNSSVGSVSSISFQLNLSLDILSSYDEPIGFEESLDDLSQSELMRELHLMVEYKLGVQCAVHENRLHLCIVVGFVVAIIVLLLSFDGHNIKSTDAGKLLPR